MRGEHYLDQAPGAVLHPWLKMCAELLQIVSQKFIATLKTHFMNANALYNLIKLSNNSAHSAYPVCLLDPAQLGYVPRVEVIELQPRPEIKPMRGQC